MGFPKSVNGDRVLAAETHGEVGQTRQGLEATVAWRQVSLDLPRCAGPFAYDTDTTSKAVGEGVGWSRRCVSVWKRLQIAWESC